MPSFKKHLEKVYQCLLIKRYNIEPQTDPQTINIPEYCLSVGCANIVQITLFSPGEN